MCGKSNGSTLLVKRYRSFQKTKLKCYKNHKTNSQISENEEIWKFFIEQKASIQIRVDDPGHFEKSYTGPDKNHPDLQPCL
jgi:hypothetical protein